MTTALLSLPVRNLFFSWGLTTFTFSTVWCPEGCFVGVSVFVFLCGYGRCNGHLGYVAFCVFLLGHLRIVDDIWELGMFLCLRELCLVGDDLLKKETYIIEPSFIVLRIDVIHLCLLWSSTTVLDRRTFPECPLPRTYFRLCIARLGISGDLVWWVCGE